MASVINDLLLCKVQNIKLEECTVDTAYLNHIYDLCARSRKNIPNKIIFKNTLTFLLRNIPDSKTISLDFPAA